MDAACNITVICINGSRDFDDYSFMKEKMDLLLGFFGKVCIISGGARGADTLAEKYANETGIPFVEYPADWEGLGRKAGHIRNSQMIDNSTVLASFWDGESRGAKDAIDKAFKAKNDVHVFMTN